MTNQARKRTSLFLTSILALAALLAPLLALPTSVAADPPPPPDSPAANPDGGTGGDFLVSTASGFQKVPAIAHNPPPADEYLVVWEEDEDIRGQIFSAQGAPQGGSFAICTHAGEQHHPAVAYAYNAAADQYLVVWTDRRSGSYDIYGQLVNADGTLPTGDDPAVNFAICTQAGTQWYPAVAYNATADEYLVVWDDGRNGDTDIYGRRVDADGTLLPGGSDPTVNFAISAAAGDQGYPSVAYNDAADEYLVVWQDNRGFSRDIYGQRVRADEVLLPVNNPTFNFAICNAVGDQYFPSVAYNAANDEYLVVWENHWGNREDIYGQRVGANGALLPVGDPTMIAISTAQDSQNHPSVAYNAAGNQYLVVWQDNRDNWGRRSDVYGQRVGADGTLAQQGNLAISKAIGDQMYPVLAYSAAAQQYLVVWEDWRSESGRSHIYGQRVWWPGLPIGHDFAVSAPGTRQDPAVAYDTLDHRYLAVWADDAGGDFDIYGQLYDRYDCPVGSPFVIMDLEGDQINPAVAYNPDDYNYLVVFEGPGGIGGQLVTTQGSLLREPFFVYEEAGMHRPAVAYGHSADPDRRGYLVVFDNSTTIVGCVLYQLVPSNSFPAGSVVQISSTIGGDNQSPDVAYDPDDDQFLVAWQGNESGNWDIYGQRVGLIGTLELEGDPITVSAAAQGQQRPAVTYNPDQNQYLVVWDDFRSGSVFDVYAQKINPADGSLDGGNFQVSTSAPAASQGRPDVVYADAVGRYHVVWQDDRDTGTLGWDLRGQWLGGDGANLGTLDAPLVRYFGDQQAPAIVYSEGQTQYNKALAVWEDTRSGGSDIYGSFGTLDDDPPLARFRRWPPYGQAGQVFTFNAWPSIDDVTPRGDLLFRWDFTSNGSWDTPLSTESAYVTRTVNLPGTYNVTLEVWDGALLTDTLTLPIYVTTTVPSQRAAVALAQPPTVTLAVTPTWAVAGTTFSFDGTGSTGTGTLWTLWDWEHDGLFDTAFGTSLQATHAYTVAGDYSTRLLVRDDTGLSRSALAHFTVVPGAATQVEASLSQVTVVPGEVVRFQATAWDQYGNVMHHPDVTWSVTNPAAGTIDASGVFTASLAAGTYADVVQVTGGSASDTVTVTIAWPYELYLPMVLK